MDEVKYSPANGTEWEKFLENNCYRCSKFDDRMMYDRDINKCNILFKLLEQQGLSEEDFPDIYRFKASELDVSQYPAKCLQRKER